MLRFMEAEKQSIEEGDQRRVGVLSIHSFHISFSVPRCNSQIQALGLLNLRLTFEIWFGIIFNLCSGLMFLFIEIKSP